MKIFSLVGLIILLIFLYSFSSSEEKESLKPVPGHMEQGFESIKAGDSYSYLEFIAANELEGRDTASRGLTIARKYIRSLYQIWGIKPVGDWKEEEKKTRVYEQRIDMVEVCFGENTRMDVVCGSRQTQFEWDKDFRGGGGALIPSTIEAPAVFAGYGLSAPDLGYDDFQGMDVRNKIVVISTGRPGGEHKDTPFNSRENRTRFEGRNAPAEKCARLLAGKGALALLIIDERVGRVDNAGGYREGSRIQPARKQVIIPRLNTISPMVPFFWASSSVAETLFDGTGRSFKEVKEQIDTNLKPWSMDLPRSKVTLCLDIECKPTVSANLLGMVEGSDPVLKNEYVVIGAHLDHVGMNKDGYVFNGADDNGSGSVGVLQIAKALALNPVKPKRSILLAHWTGEEKGLLGSRTFVEDPAGPLTSIVAYINLDMISRNTPLDSIVKAAKELGVTREQLSFFPDESEKLLAGFSTSPCPLMADSAVRLGRDYCGLIVVPLSSYPMLGNSDHYPFSQKKIPTILFNTERHQDLHQPSDTVEKINPEKMSRIVKLTYLLAFTIADSPNRPGWDR